MASVVTALAAWTGSPGVRELPFTRVCRARQAATIGNDAVITVVQGDKKHLQGTANERRLANSPWSVGSLCRNRFLDNLMHMM